jgi:hypothetical protein
MTQGNIGGRRDSGLRELGPDDTPEYTEWLRHNPTGFVLILTGGLARLHEADCAHIQPYPTDKKGMPKVVGRSIRGMRAWASEHGRQFVLCRSCR